MSRGRKPSETLTKAQRAKLAKVLKKQPDANIYTEAERLFPGRKVNDATFALIREEHGMEQDGEGKWHEVVFTYDICDQEADVSDK